MREPMITSFDIEDGYVKPAPVVRKQKESVRSKERSDGPAIPNPSGRYYIPGAAFTVLIIGMLVFVMLKVTDPETLPIRNVGVAGEFSHLSPERLQERVGDVVRGGFFSVNVEKIQSTLLEEPWIRDVAVKRVWPDRIIVTISEQVAIARWGDDGLVNDEGDIFRPDQASFPADLPTLQGPENSSHNMLDMLDQIKKILPHDMTLQQLTLSERRSWELMLGSGPVIRLGKNDVLPRLEKFLRYAAAGGLNDMTQIEYIDMRYTNGFAVLRKADNKTGPETAQENHGKKI